MARLLSAGDLPGGLWKMMDERSWRTGSIGPATPCGQRSRAAKNVVVWRSFEKKDDEKWTWIQIVPFVSADYAKLDLEAAAQGDGIPNLRAEVRLVAQTFDEEAEYEGLNAVRVLTQDTSDPRGDNKARMIYCLVGSFLSVVACTSYGDRLSLFKQSEFDQSTRTNFVEEHPSGPPPLGECVSLPRTSSILNLAWCTTVASTSPALL